MELKKSYEFFSQNRTALFKKYGHKFVAIKNANIIGVYDNEDVALNTTLKTEELGTFLIQELNQDNSKDIQYFQGNVYFPGQAM